MFRKYIKGCYDVLVINYDNDKYDGLYLDKYFNKIEIFEELYMILKLQKVIKNKKQVDNVESVDIK